MDTTRRNRHQFRPVMYLRCAGCACNRNAMRICNRKCSYAPSVTRPIAWRKHYAKRTQEGRGAGSMLPTMVVMIINIDDNDDGVIMMMTTTVVVVL